MKRLAVVRAKTELVGRSRFRHKNLGRLQQVDSPRKRNFVACLAADQATSILDHNQHRLHSGLIRSALKSEQTSKHSCNNQQQRRRSTLIFWIARGQSLEAFVDQSTPLVFRHALQMQFASCGLFRVAKHMKQRSEMGGKDSCDLCEL